ncbi:MAG: DUF3144 domain-containing protein [Pseudomonadota bacterium]|nr:DUF3144 domain-containing protein [Pseudomonadota bacterium]
MKVPEKDYEELVSRFIGLANEMKNENKDVNLIANSLMEASCVYVTYVAAGNEGYLQDSGITKLLEAYRKILTKVQARKKRSQEAGSAETS